MKHILMIVVTLFSVISFAQTHPQKPSQRIQQEKASGASFENISLFNSIDSQKSREQIPSELKEYTVFAFDKGKLASFKSKVPMTMNLAIPLQKSAISVELVKVDIRTEDFEITEMPSGKTIRADNSVIHYRGIVKGQPNSIAAISFFDNEVSGIISIGEESSNFVIGKLDNSKNQIIYKDKDISHLNDFVCQMADDPYNPYTEEQLADTDQTKAAVKCPRIFFDIANDIVRDKGGAQGASNYIQAVFNQVSVLFANDDISIKLSGIKAWTSTAPFNGLNNYRNYRNQNSFNGDLGHFVTYNFSGGVAWVNSMCSSYKYGVSGIRSSYSNVPTYSWTVNVIAHELGHNLGSQHTQSCVWNGNNTAIDGCYGTEGNCPRPGIPSNGGTIMSYCHLTNVGINLNKGFGPQPRNVIRNSINSKSCVQTCDGGGGGNPCTGVPQWQSGVNYAIGDLVVYQGNLFERVNTATGWKNLGPCDTAPTDPCEGVSEWSNQINYSVGDRVTYQGNLFVRTSTGWDDLGACGVQRAALALPPDGSTVLPKEFTIVAYPNPAKDKLNIEINNLINSSYQLSLKDMNGRVLKTIIVNSLPGEKGVQQLDVSNLRSGVYFVQIKNAEKTLTQKVFIE